MEWAMRKKGLPVQIIVIVVKAVDGFL